MGAPGDGAGYLVEMELHRLGVGEGESEARTRAPGRADRPEQIGAFVALVGGLDGPRSAPRPLPDKAVLLADARLVLEPDFNGLALGYAREMRRKRAAEVFLNAAMVAPSCLGCRGLALM